MRYEGSENEIIPLFVVFLQIIPCFSYAYYYFVPNLRSCDEKHQKELVDC